MNLGLAYQGLSQYARAINLYQKTLPIFRWAGDRSGEANDLMNTGNAYDNLSQSVKAIDFYQQALTIYKQTGDQNGEAKDLGNIGLAYKNLSQHQKAIIYYGQALLIDQQIGDRGGEASDLNHLMSAQNSQQQPRLAIFYGKQSVNVYQSIRAGLQTMDQQTQKTYLASVSGTYRNLADLLIGQGRLPEADEVLDMLKRQEQSDALRGPVTLPGIPGQVDLTPTEAAQEQVYQQVADQITALGQQQQALLDKDALAAKGGPAFTPADRQQLDAVTAQLKAANGHLRRFLDQLAAVFKADTPLQARLLDIKRDDGVQDTLRRLHEQGQDVVVLKTLVADDRFAVIVTTAKSQKVEQFPINAAEFNKKVAALQDALRSPTADPTGPAHALYEIVFAPLEKDLAQAHAKTLMWSLDGSLRYIPIAALYDGRQYLVERFDNEVFTLGSQSGFGSDEQGQWNALGLGVTQTRTVSDPAGGQSLTFPALSGVAPELHGVVRDAAHPGGALPGTVLLDTDFSQQAMTDDLHTQRYNVVHIASHFALRPGDPGASFLLLGAGAWTLADMKDDSTLFSQVDLLALSACDTASGGADGDGTEVDSLGSVAQGDGAKSVLASLWPVADASTRLLMEGFYRWHETHPGVSKAEALRQAQLSLLRGTASPADGTASRGVETARNRSDAGLPPFTPDPKAPYAHPYYWAPFVLIGNWK